MTMSTRKIYSSAIGLSLVAHAAAIGVWAIGWAPSGKDLSALPDPVKTESIVAINISAAPSGGTQLDEPIADLAAAAIETADLEPVEGSEEDEAGPMSGDAMIWTPPPPQIQAVPAEREKEITSPLVIEMVGLPGERSEPVLVSYAASVSSNISIAAEVRRRGGSGRIKLSVEIDDVGVPLGCSVIESSGSNLLDAHGCEVVLGYRYEPATDRLGKPSYGRAFEYLEWGMSDALDRVEQPVTIAGAGA